MAKGYRVLLLTQWFDPEPTFKGLVFARELVMQGFEVEVITGFPNYPCGMVYSGYRIKLIQKDVIDGVVVTRVPLYPSHDQGAVGRIVNYVSFAVSSLLYGLFFAKNADLIYAYHPPLTVGVSAVLLRFFRQIPVVYDIQDMWPDTLRATGMFSNERALRLVSRVCNWVYKYVNSIVVLSPGFKRLLIERGIPSAKIDVIYNWCAEDAISNCASAPPAGFPADGFRVLFAGNMGKAQALPAVLDAAEILLHESPTARFLFLGGGVEVKRLKEIVQAKRLANVSFLPAVPMNEVGKYLGVADALLVHLKRDPLFRITIPSKTQAYMAAGKPIVMAVDGDAADLVREAKCGFVAESENPRSIADAVNALIHLSVEQREDLANRGKAFYAERLSLRMGVAAFGEIFMKSCRRCEA
jgi:glycosyltransferase involved in cell wall biosynthesis